MDNQKTIVVSAVNLRQGGTLTILRDCLQYLSDYAKNNSVRVVAIVHKKELNDFPGIEYIEMPHVIKSWFKRLWCEYVTFYKLSKQLQPVSLWLSLHDTTPRVIAEKQAVYCQTSFPFYKSSWQDLFFSYKIVLFSFLTRFAYRINVHQNKYLIVQQPWLRDGLSKLLGVSEEKFLVAPPEKSSVSVTPEKLVLPYYTFIYPSAPDCHKNFQVLCEAARLLEEEVGDGKFRVVLTIKGNENDYTRWLYKKWKTVKSIDFAGFMSKEKLYGYYQAADCMVFPSKVETWGLPISEFSYTGKPIIVSNLPYAHGTASGTKQTAFFNPDNSYQLKDLMLKALKGIYTDFKEIPLLTIKEPVAYSWKELIDKLLFEE